MDEFTPDQLKDLLPLYYKRLFPFGPFYRWLSYGGGKSNVYFQNREFSFTLAEDIYVRYQSFSSQDEMEKEIQKRCPFKIDIGAVYTKRPKEHRVAQGFQPVEKELVFDIDMTDYDEVRNCCSGADVCDKCWNYMVIATHILDTALRDDFGYNQLLWVFSGRRGVHCWVCDEAARRLTSSDRGAIAEYLQLVTGGDNQTKKVALTADRLHPSIRRAVGVIEPQFVAKFVEGQNILSTSERLAKVLALIPDEQLRVELGRKMADLGTSRQRWDMFVSYINDQKAKGLLKWKSKHLVEEVMLQYTYPRLDIEVSKGLNHLLKSPFCIHPKTGKVCTPFNPRAAHKFNPSVVPTISTLVEEIRQFDLKEVAVGRGGEDEVKRRVKDYKKTSLYKGVVVFEEFVRNLEETWKGKKIEESGRCSGSKC